MSFVHVIKRFPIKKNPLRFWELSQKYLIHHLSLLRLEIVLLMKSPQQLRRHWRREYYAWHATVLTRAAQVRNSSFDKMARPASFKEKGFHKPFKEEQNLGVNETHSNGQTSHSHYCEKPSHFINFFSMQNYKDTIADLVNKKRKLYNKLYWDSPGGEEDSTNYQASASMASFSQ